MVAITNKEKDELISELTDLLEQAWSFIKYHEDETHLVLDRERMSGFKLNEDIAEAVLKARAQQHK